MTLAEKVAYLLKEQRRSKRWLAGQVGLTHPSIIKILMGGDTSYRIAFKLAAKLGVRAGWLINDAEELPPEKELDARNLSNSQMMDELWRRKMILVKGYAPLLERYREFKADAVLIAKRATDRGRLEDADVACLREARATMENAWRLYLPEIQQWIQFEDRLNGLNLSYMVEPEASELRRTFRILSSVEPEENAFFQVLWAWGRSPDEATGDGDREAK
jgi:transcriptional regulator with XRE-family HTH domain